MTHRFESYVWPVGHYPEYERGEDLSPTAQAANRRKRAERARSRLLSLIENCEARASWERELEKEREVRRHAAIQALRALKIQQLRVRTKKYVSCLLRWSVLLPEPHRKQAMCCARRALNQFAEQLVEAT